MLPMLRIRPGLVNFGRGDLAGAGGEGPVPEIQRLLTTATMWRIPPTPDLEFHLAWSDWRRRHQARARWHHYRTRLALTA